MAAAHTSELPPANNSDDSQLNRDDPWAIEPMPRGLIDSPLDFIFAEHLRQRQAASILTMVADGEFKKSGVIALIEFLETDFALHIGDEEIALFPLLKDHCLPEDNIVRVLDLLQEEHREDESNCEDVLALLRASLQGEALDLKAKRRLRSFAEHICQHLALENGVLLPIARVRLKEPQLSVLKDMLKARRSTG